MAGSLGFDAQPTTFVNLAKWDLVYGFLFYSTLGFGRAFLCQLLNAKLFSAQICISIPGCEGAFVFADDGTQPLITPTMLVAALLLHTMLSSQFLAMAAPIQLFPRADSLEGAPFDTNYRSTADIVWSCIVTVFACTWLSVHPNVSGFNSSWIERMKHRLYLMIWGISAPEFLVIFAYRQWRGSKDITRVIRKVIEDDKLGHSPRI
jgi:hypothetical protein